MKIYLIIPLIALNIMVTPPLKAQSNTNSVNNAELEKKINLLMDDLAHRPYGWMPPEVQSRISTASTELINMGNIVVPFLSKRLEERKDWGTMSHFPYILYIIGDERCIPSLIKSAKNGNFCTYDILAAFGAKDAIPILIEALKTTEPTVNNHDERVREEAICALRKLTKIDFGYDYKASLEKRNPSVIKWEKWWEENKNTFVTFKSTPTYLDIRHYDLTKINNNLE